VGSSPTIRSEENVVGIEFTAELIDITMLSL